eukprot:SAG31_NODE_16353_length_712_cov_1.358891_1_plen_24_part_10
MAAASGDTTEETGGGIAAEAVVDA